MSLIHSTRRRGVVLAVVASLTLALVTLLTTASAPLSSATPSAVNPLDDHPWPMYRGRAETVYLKWQEATGDTKVQLWKIVGQPRVNWISNTTPVPDFTTFVRKRIADFHQDSPGGYAQLAVFGLFPHYERNKKEPLTPELQAYYRNFINAVARGIGDSKVIMILEPDLGVSWTGWRPEVRFALANYAARVFSRLPNTHIYLDASDSDWLSVDKATRTLIASGIRYVRGFALGATHYTSARANIVYGGRIVNALAARGYKGKKFVIDTADNGRPFTFAQYYKAHPRGLADNANVCRTRSELRCVTLGIKPTTDTANPRWGMTADVRAIAARSCDAFLWFGRPWLHNQASPFDMARALGVARTTPWQ